MTVVEQSKGNRTDGVMYLMPIKRMLLCELYKEAGSAADLLELK